MFSDAPKRKDMAAVLLVLVAFFALFAWLCLRFDSREYLSGPIYRDAGIRYDDYEQYNHLADALIDGHAYLDIDVPDWLSEMENPYDANLRTELAAESGEAYYWDCAFYKGRYYCYFGNLPALLLFVPFRLLTGNHLPTPIAVLLLACLASIAMARFLYFFYKRHFPSMGLGVYCASLAMLITGTGLITQVFIPFFYAIPPLSSLFFVFAGLTAWIRARSESGELSIPKLVIGSLCIAATLGCRPQLVFAVFLAFPIFWQEITEERRFFSKQGLANTAAVVVPFFALCALAMWWNYIRFDSLFDFGASFNLTGFDMTVNSQQGFRVGAFLAAIWYYIFAPPNPLRVFPFFELVNEPYFGEWVPVEPFYGSFLFFTPPSIGIIALPAVREQLSKKRLGGICAVSLAIGLALMIISPQVASVSMRYFSDFGWAILIPVLAVWPCLVERYESKATRLKAAFVALSLLGVSLYLWTMLCTERFHALVYTSPDVYRFFESLFSAAQL